MENSLEILPDNAKFDTLEQYIKWLGDRVRSYESYMIGKDPFKFPCMECSLRELKLALSHAKSVTKLQ